MKRFIIFYSGAFLLIMFVCTVGSASNVYYNMPFLHTSTNNVVYCWLSNLSGSSVSGTNFTVKANETNNPPKTAVTFPSSAYIPSGGTHLITFTGQSIYYGTTQAADLSSSTGTSSAYGGVLQFTSTGTGDITCKNIVMACFQGTTNPKRNIVGNVCEDDSNSTI